MDTAQGRRWRSALLEGIAVLIGILLAFGIQAWWDVQSQAAEARSYLMAMQAELLSNRDIILEDLDSLRSWTLQSREFLESVAAPGARPSYERVLEMAWETDPRSTPPLVRAALDDLTSSGGFQIIDDPEVRRTLASYQRALDRDAIEQQKVREFFTGTVQRYHILEGSFSEFPWEEYVGVDELDVTFSLPVEAFASNRTYANLLIVRMLGFSNLRDRHQDLLREIDAALAEISRAI